MAPSRRRGAARASAAAARRQWKVGDLVLAKLKGFPAWPATVSEPEKWDYTSDWKKVFVYFFGTQQIAFCNPADLELFTEEKKKSLSAKRHGKSADFVRALEEIIDSFDKAKKEEHVEDCNSGEALANCGNSVAQNEVIGGTTPSAGTVTCKMDPTFQNHDVADIPLSDSFDNKEYLLDQSVNNEEKPVMATYTSRKRSGGSRSRKYVAQKKVASPETPLSSHQVASGRIQSSALLSRSSRVSVGNLLSNLARDGSRRTKHIRKSPNDTENEDVDSSAFVTNVSIEDNVSEIVTADSDSLSINEVATVDSSYKVEHREAAAERLGEEVQLTGSPDFQIKAVVIRKKRKPSRKRASNETCDPTAGADARTNVEIGAINTDPNLQPVSQNGKNTCSKEDGDEHLPLVKRARVRMGELPSLSEEFNTHQSESQAMSDGPVSPGLQNGPVQTEERTPRELAQVTSSANDGRQTRRDLAVDQILDNLSPSENSSQMPAGKVLFSSSKDSQFFCHLPDEESALPPSKRLHRALEAMSANVAEGISVMNNCVGGSAPDDIGSINRKEQCPDSVDDGVPLVCLSSNEVLEEVAISLPKADSSSKKTELLISSESPKTNLHENLDHRNLEDFDGLALQSASVDEASVDGETCVNLLLDAGQHFNALESHETLLEQQLPLLNKDVEPESHQSDIIRVESPVACEEDSERIAESTPQIVQGAQGNGPEVLEVTMDLTMSKNVVSQSSKIDENHQMDGRHKVEKDDDQILREASGITFSDDNCSGKDILVVQPPTMSADDESPARMSQSTISVCRVSTSESANNQNSGGSSPNTNSNQRRCGTIPADEEKVDPAVPERPKSIGRCGSHVEQLSDLSSFEELLGSLTRTKECIARATRMAMDCAKLGASLKVMETLTRNLECESSLHKRVDLFFLVDSIAQCSRGSKGDVGAACLSAIQAVLPRLLSSAVPSGSSVQENRRQCLKVLKLWLERRILPEPIIRRHIRDLESFGPSTSAAYCRRSARTDRALDDPIRDMEGMHVDEYGSNSSFQLPGFCMPRMLKDEEDEGSDSDGGSFEAVTPEHHCDAPEKEKSIPAIGKHTHILEDVDGELEMEDVAPSCEIEMSLTNNAHGVDCTQSSQGQFGQHFSSQYAPPLPQEVPPSSPPLPSSPPPPPPPPPPPVLPVTGHASCGGRDPYGNNLDTRPYRNTHNLQSDPRMNPSTSNGVHYPSECRDQADMQFYDSCNTSRAMNSSHHVDGHGYRHKSHPPRPPPHLPPPDHFPYVNGSQHVKSRRETPPRSYSHRYHSPHDGNFYNNHERNRPGPYEFDDNWSYPAPPHPGPRYHERSKSSYAPFPYERPSREPTRLPHHGWDYPPRGMHHHREFMHHSEERVSASNRGPNMWRHR